MATETKGLSGNTWKYVETGGNFPLSVFGRSYSQLLAVMGEKRQGEIAIGRRFGGEFGEGGGSALGPVGTGELGDGEERTPRIH
jgi:hypothetical protein